jgi:hypothetical protein
VDPKTIRSRLKLIRERHEHGDLTLGLTDPLTNEVTNTGLHRSALLVIEQVEQFGDVVETQPELLTPGDESQRIEIILSIGAVAGHRALGDDHSLLFIEPQRRHRETGGSSGL